nr:MAG TPA: hypothetical protein [Caudoviricetes sp.]
MSLSAKFLLYLLYHVYLLKFLNFFSFSSHNLNLKIAPTYFSK